MHLRRRSQMKIGESIVILVIFMFLVMFGLIFYVRFYLINWDQASAEKAELLAIQAVQKVQTMPEFQCSIRGNIKFHCIDLLKLNTFKEMDDDKKLIYKSIFPQTHISIYQIYPETETPEAKSWKIYGGDISSEKTQLLFYVPVALYNATDGDFGTFNFGYINITVVS